MPAKVNETQFVDRWATGTKQNTGRYKEGVNSVSEAPGVKAAAQADAYLAGITEAVSSGRWQRGVEAVSLSDWKRAASEKGTARIASGVDGAMPKMRERAGPLLAAINATMAEVDALPKGGLENSIVRATTWMRGMAGRKIK